MRRSDFRPTSRGIVSGIFGSIEGMAFHASIQLCIGPRLANNVFPGSIISLQLPFAVLALLIFHQTRPLPRLFHKDSFRLLFLGRSRRSRVGIVGSGGGSCRLRRRCYGRCCSGRLRFLIGHEGSPLRNIRPIGTLRFYHNCPAVLFVLGLSARIPIQVKAETGI